jgi:hypothetical protein
MAATCVKGVISGIYMLGCGRRKGDFWSPTEGSAPKSSPDSNRRVKVYGCAGVADSAALFRDLPTQLFDLL